MTPETTPRHWLTTLALVGTAAAFAYLVYKFWGENTISMIFTLPYLVCEFVTLWLLLKPLLKPWFEKHRIRIRLLTALLLMFVAGGILFLNVEERFDQVSFTSGGGTYGIQGICRGWPMPFHVQTLNYPGFGIPSVLVTNLLIDTVVGMGLLICVGIVSEWAIRKR